MSEFARAKKDLLRSRSGLTLYNKFQK